MSVTTMDRPKSIFSDQVKCSWDDIEREFGLLSSDDVAVMLGTRALNKARNKMIAIKMSRNLVYPGFQFDSTGALRPTIEVLVKLANENGIEFTWVAQWMCLRSEFLNGFRPVDLINEEDILVAAFKNRFPVMDWSKAPKRS